MRQGTKQPAYRVFLYVEGSDLPYVKSVTYHLHETFRNNVRKVQRTPSNPNCQLVIWTWGLFEMRVVVEDKFGQTKSYNHLLTYDRDFETAKFVAV